MAGIVYRSCEFDDAIGAAVTTYQEHVLSRNKAFREAIQTTERNTSGFSDLRDLGTVLDEAIGAMGMTSRNALRARFGLPKRPETKSEMEEWLLGITGTVVINGRYMIRDESSVQLQPYRTVFNIIGLTALETGLSSGKPYVIHTLHDGVVYSTSPISVAEQLGLAVSELDSILLLWNGGITQGVRNSIVSNGVQAGQLYSVLKGRNVDNITTVVAPRVDLMSRLRSMGMNTADITLLLTRPVPAITVDTKILRTGDNEESLPGPYQSYPYPGEIARALRSEMALFPAVGDVTPSGAKTYIPPAVVLMRVINPEKTFGAVSLVQRASDKIGPAEVTGQAALAVSDMQLRELNTSFAALQPQAEHYIEQGAITEETMAFFGIDTECGTSTKENGSFNFWDSVLSPRQQGAIDTLLGEWGGVTANINFKGSLLGNLGISLGRITCEAKTFGCQSNSILPNLGAEGGPWDSSGGTNAALDDVSDVFKSTERLLEAFSNIAPDMALVTQGLGSLRTLSTEPCASPANVGFLNGIKRG